MSTARIAVLEAFRYIFGAIATTGDRRKDTVMGWARILAHVTGTVDQELLARNQYLATVRDQSAFQLVFQDAVFAERATLGEIGNRLGRKVLAEVAPSERVIMARPRAR